MLVALVCWEAVYATLQRRTCHFSRSSSRLGRARGNAILYRSGARSRTRMTARRAF